MSALGFRKPMEGFARRTAAALPVRGDGSEGGISEGEANPVLVIGGGGREHVLCYAFQRSPICSEVYCAPGNAGIGSSGDAHCVADLDIRNSEAVIAFCQKSRVGLVVVGPEAPLVAGLVDEDLRDAGIHAFGPSAAAATLEGSKDFMKRLCEKYSIPMAAGNGVVVAATLKEAFAAVDFMLVTSEFGACGGVSGRGGGVVLCNCGRGACGAHGVCARPQASWRW